MSAAATLRARTAAHHDEVDAAFGAFALGQPGSYRDFLLAHARALPAAELVLANTPNLPSWRARTPLLARDLAELDAAMPLAFTFAAPSFPFAWGVLYVTEGSRLGGGMLAQQVGTGLPRRYLHATFAPGEWRALRAAFDAQAERHGNNWLADAITGAQACFALYHRAVGPSVPAPRSAR